MGRKQERDKNKEGGQRRIRRRKKRVDNSGQLVLYEASRTEGGVERPSGEQWRGVRKYDDPQPEGILIGREDLKSYLQRRGESRVLKLRELIRGLELKGFYQQAPKAGRRPYHPASMVGLILLGLMEGKSSLRQLEVMARTDIRSWWISGGIQPDHSVIGRFIQQHREQLSEGFFVELTREVLKRTGSRGGDLAGDGTVIQSAASRYRRLSQEAIEMAAQETEKASLQEPDNSELLAQKQRLQELAEKVKQQQKRRRSRSKRARKVSPSDPEAVIQPLSRGGPSAASYKPVVLSNEQQIVVAQELDASCEHAVFEQLLELARQSSGEVERLRWDSGAFNFDVCVNQG